MMKRLLLIVACCVLLQSVAAAASKTLNVLFIGNSFTGRHDLSQVVKTLAEEGNPGLDFKVTTVIYGGRILKDHWRLGTANFVRLYDLTAAEEQKTIDDLKATMERDPKDTHAKVAYYRHQELLKSLDGPRPKWDIVVLQSYRDDLEGDQSLYVEYAPKYAKLIHAQGARVVLYVTVPEMQNEEPIEAPEDRGPAVAKSQAMARLAKKIDATVVPMPMVAQRCHEQRPDLTLRFVNDGHLNQTMAYLTACTFYGALFDRSPEGLKSNTVTDTRYLDADHRDQDRDGKPIKTVFSAKDRVDLQRIAWEGLQAFRKLGSTVSAK